MATSTKESGILDQFVPIIENDQHKTWRSTSGNEYWDFEVIMRKNDGTDDKGVMSSTSTEPKWKAGTKCTYDRTEYTNERGTLVKFSKYTPEKAAGGYRGGGKQLSKEDRDRIIRAVALEVAHNAIIDLNRVNIITNFKSITATANVFAKFVYQFSKGIKEKEMMLENSLRRGVDGIQMKKLKDTMIQGTKFTKDQEGNLTIEVPATHPEDFWKEELRNKDIEGIWSANELKAYAGACFSYIWEGTKEDGSILPINEIQ